MIDATGEATMGGGGDAADFRAALEAFMSGSSPLVVLAESVDGSVEELVSMLPPDLGPVARARGAEATRAAAGRVAEELGLGESSASVLLVEDCQWADPSSLGRLQRLVKQGSHVLMILSYRPGVAQTEWWIENLADQADRSGTLVRTTVAGSKTEPIQLDAGHRDLVVAARLVSIPLPVSVASGLLGVSEDQALDVAEQLVREGLLRDERNGFTAAPSAALVEVGPARLGHIAARLAQALSDAGADDAVVGSLRLTAGDAKRAYPLLRSAALEAQRRHASGEAFELAQAALQAAEAESVDRPTELGELRLICGRHLRDMGRSEAAQSELEAAGAMLEGPARIDALGFAAAVADDRQHPQGAERILAVAEWESVNQGEPAKLGSLGSFRARALNRIGFAAEADALLEKSLAILEAEATPVQRYYAEQNRAWILFDRGQVSQAEAVFTHLRDTADPADLATIADKEAWRARALFVSGRPDEALTAVEAARQLSARADVEAPLFLADLALSEGALSLGRYDDALAASDRVLDLVERQLPAWENVARAERAQALLGLGETEAAAAEIAAALAATPAGPDGWRWRSRCRAIRMEVAAEAGRGWSQREAEDLADMFLQSEFYGWAAELMVLIAGRNRDSEVAREAMALAVQVGNPMLAARAASIGKLWKEPGSGPVIRAVRSVEERLPEDWRETWRSIPAVAEALAAPEPGSGAGDENAAVLEQALRRAGLSGADVVLSPAQRRHRGLVQRRRRWRPLQLVAAALGVIVVAAGTSVGVAQLVKAPPSVTVVTQVLSQPTVAPTVPTLENTEIALPEGVDFLFGNSYFRGGPTRTGFEDVRGPVDVTGRFWTYETAALIDATPIVYGRNLLVGSTDGNLYAIDASKGEVMWTFPTEGRISASPAIGEVNTGEGKKPAMVVVVGDDGVVRARDAVTQISSQMWSTNLGARIRSSPVVAGDQVYVATTDGHVFALSLLDGSESWRYPAEGDGIGSVTAGLTYVDGTVYVGTEEGRLDLIDAETGQTVCTRDLAAGISVAPIVSDGALYVPTRGNTIFAMPVGACDGSVPDRLPLYATETAVDVAPAIVGDHMYLPAGEFLYSLDLKTNLDYNESWSPSKVDTDSMISAAPVVTNDTVYFGTQDGTVYAVDAETGDERWQWHTGNSVWASPTVIDGAVFIASGDGKVYAVGDG